jgi:DedD protein
MSLAFWRRKQTAPDAIEPRSKRSSASDEDGRADAAAALRARARRRLIGAAALLLIAIIVVPMALDPEPKPVAENIPIDIPSEKTKFAPRLALPPQPESTPVVPPPVVPPPVVPPPDAPPPAASGAAAAPAAGAAAEPAKATPPAGAAKTEEQRARAALEDKGADKLPPTSRGGKFAVQAAATSTEAAARELAERLRKSGLTPYTERVETAEGARWRVRVGPYASREDAERVRTRLKSLGIAGNVVGAS